MNIGNLPPCQDTNIEEPSKNNKPIFDKELLAEIIIELDGWQVNEPDDISDDSEIFIDFENDSELKNIDSNKKISYEEVEIFYDKAFNEALSDTNRYDIDDLNKMEVILFMEGVIKLTASNMWIKCNTAVTVNNEEGIIDYGQGGKLYKKYLNHIENFVKGVRIEISAV